MLCVQGSKIHPEYRNLVCNGIEVDGNKWKIFMGKYVGNIDYTFAFILYMCASTYGQDTIVQIVSTTVSKRNRQNTIIKYPNKTTETV